MKKTFKKVLIAIAAILTVGTVTLVSCNKDDSEATPNHNTSALKGKTDNHREALYKFYLSCDAAYQRDPRGFMRAVDNGNAEEFIDFIGLSHNFVEHWVNMGEEDLPQYMEQHPEYFDEQNQPCRECGDNPLQVLSTLMQQTNGHMAEYVPLTLVRTDFGNYMSCYWRCAFVPLCGRAACWASCMGTYLLDRYDFELMSYTGGRFTYKPAFENDQDNIGEWHNVLMDGLDQNWTKFRNRDLVEFAANYTQQITGYQLAAVGMSNEEFVENLVSDVAGTEDMTYSEMVKRYFEPYLSPEALVAFVEDVNAVAYGDLSFDEMYFEMQKIEQKLYNSHMDEEGIKLAMIFTSVFKHSEENIEKILSNPSSNFYRPLMCRFGGAKRNNQPGGGVDKGDAVLADAAGAVEGAVRGAVAGAAGGPWGMVLVGTIGAVCYGGLHTATNVAIEQPLARWIGSWFD